MTVYVVLVNDRFFGVYGLEEDAINGAIQLREKLRALERVFGGGHRVVVEPAEVR